MNNNIDLMEEEILKEELNILKQEAEEIENKIIKVHCINKNNPYCLQCAMKEIPSVFYEAKNNFKYFFLGANPGNKEIKQRRPFVGESGKLLRKIIKEYFFEGYVLTNSILCYSSNTKKLENIEQLVKNCYRFWLNLLKEAEPDVLILLGKISYNSAKNIFPLSDNINFTSMHFLGIFALPLDNNRIKKIKIFSVPHPSYVIRGKMPEEKYIELFHKISKLSNSLVKLTKQGGLK